MDVIPEPLRPVIARGLAKDPKWRPSEAALRRAARRCDHQLRRGLGGARPVTPGRGGPPAAGPAVASGRLAGGRGLGGGACPAGRPGPRRPVAGAARSGGPARPQRPGRRSRGAQQPGWPGPRRARAARPAHGARPARRATRTRQAPGAPGSPAGRGRPVRHPGRAGNEERSRARWFPVPAPPPGEDGCRRGRRGGGGDRRSRRLYRQLDSAAGQGPAGPGSLSLRLRRPRVGGRERGGHPGGGRADQRSDCWLARCSAPTAPCRDETVDTTGTVATLVAMQHQHARDHHLQAARQLDL